MKTSGILGKIRPHIRRALREDCPAKDITSAACVGKSQKSRAYVVARQSLVLAGLTVFTAVMKEVDRSIMVTAHCKDGQSAAKGRKVLSLYGNSRGILRAERVALNYLQRMSGIATLTALFVRQTRGTKAMILDTRKTTPTLRLLEKYAVTCGGGQNHRWSLSDAPLIKENHIRAAGGIANAVRKTKQGCKEPLVLEVTSRDEVLQGLAAGADILLLDNMSPAQVKAMVRLIRGKALVEVSGGVNLKTARRFAQAGADRISVGALTHSAPSADLSLLFEE